MGKDKKFVQRLCIYIVFLALTALFIVMRWWIALAVYAVMVRKEVIQPHLPVRLPCYDFTLLTGHSLDGSFLTVRPPALRAPDSDGVTGGVYKARERIHRGLADPRLLAIPTSCSRVADCNPNWDGFWGFALRHRFASLC